MWPAITWSELTDMSCGTAATSCPAIEDDPSANSQVKTCSIPLSSPPAGRRPLLAAARKADAALSSRSYGCVSCYNHVQHVGGQQCMLLHQHSCINRIERKTR